MSGCAKGRWNLRALALCAIASAAAWGTAPAQTAPDLNSYVGKMFIIHGRGSANEIKIRATDVLKPQGQCDAAVAVDSASESGKEIHLVLLPVGSVRYAKGSAVCPMIASQIRVTISDVRDTGPSDAATVLRDFLLTPESYMEVLGDKFDYPGGDAPDVPVVAQGTPNLIQPKLVLMVDPSFTEAARRAKVGGTAVVEITIGRDGHIYSGNLLSDPGYGLGEQALRVLALWRFAPARVDDKPVALRVSVQTTFTLR